MATLEKIRSKSVLLVSVIGVALVLFIITLVDNPFAMFQDTTTIAKVNGRKISIEDYNRRAEQALQQAQQQGRNVDNAAIQAQVLDAMVQETLFNEEIEKLGITVSDKELTEAMVGETPHPYIMQMAQNMGATSGRELYDMIFNPTQYGFSAEQADQLKAMWVQMEGEIENQLKYAKFNTLITGAITANKLDAKALYDEAGATYEIVYARKAVSSVPDSLATVTDADVRRLYDERRAAYALPEPTTLVNYINIPVVPSAADRLAAQQAVEAGIVALKEQPAMDGLAGNSAFAVSRMQSAADGITNNALRTFVTSSATDSVQLVQNNASNSLVIAKLLGRSDKIDDVTVEVAFVDYTDSNLDSILTAMNTATDLESVDGVLGAQPAQPLKLSNSGLSDEIQDKMRTAPLNEFFVIMDQQDNRASVGRISERKEPVTVYDYATATYTIEPSQTTYNELSAQLKEFLDSTATASDFTMERALRHNLNVMKAGVTASSPAIANINDSRDIVHWVMDGEKGQVSKVFTDDRNSRLTAVAIIDTYDEFVPVTDPDLNTELRQSALTDKKGEKLVADYTGKGNSVADYAAAMGTEVDTTNVNFSQPYIARLGMNQGKLMGSVAAHKTGELVGPLASGGNVIVYQIINAPEPSMPFDQAQYTTQFDRMRGNQTIAPQIGRILQGRSKVDNRILKFYTR